MICKDFFFLGPERKNGKKQGRITFLRLYPSQIRNGF